MTYLLVCGVCTQNHNKSIGCRRLYDVDQSGAETLPRVTLVERITEAFFQGKIANFDKIIDSIHERKARVKGHCPFEPY